MWKTLRCIKMHFQATGCENVDWIQDSG